MSPKQFALLLKVLSHGFASVCATMAAPMSGFEPPKQYDFEQELKEANYEHKSFRRHDNFG